MAGSRNLGRIELPDAFLEIMGGRVYEEIPEGWMSAEEISAAMGLCLSTVMHKMPALRRQGTIEARQIKTAPQGRKVWYYNVCAAGPAGKGK